MRITTLALALLLVAPAASWAEGERAYPVRAISQFGRGLTNVLLSPVEIPVNMWKEGNGAVAHGANKGRQMIALFTGMVTGTGYMVARIGIGTVEALTFPYPTTPMMAPSTPDGFLETLAHDEERGQGHKPAEMARAQSRKRFSDAIR